jgi:hypothetical protein
LAGTDQFSSAIGFVSQLCREFEERKQVRQLSEQLDVRDQTPTRPAKRTAASKKETSRAGARS